MAFLSATIRKSIDPTEPCGICGRERREHWGRRSALDPQKLGHQWRPVEPKPCWCGGEDGEHNADAHAEEGRW